MFFFGFEKEKVFVRVVVDHFDSGAFEVVLDCVMFEHFVGFALFEREGVEGVEFDLS